VKSMLLFMLEELLFVRENGFMQIMMVSLFPSLSCQSEIVQDCRGVMFFSIGFQL
jgi:hypothetical protein